MLEIPTVCVTHGVRTWVSRCESSTRSGTKHDVYRSVPERDPTAPTQISPRPPSIPTPRFPISYFLVEAHKSPMVMCSIIMLLNDILDYPDASTGTESLLHGSETAEIQLLAHALRRIRTRSPVPHRSPTYPLRKFSFNAMPTFLPHPLGSAYNTIASRNILNIF